MSRVYDLELKSAGVSDRMECIRQKGDAMIHKARDNSFRLIFSERRLQEMFSLIEHYDVQETRRIAKAEGIAEGIAEGRGDERIAIAKRSLEKRMSIEDIVSITGLTYEEVEDLTKQ